MCVCLQCEILQLPDQTERGLQLPSTPDFAVRAQGRWLGHDLHVCNGPRGRKGIGNVQVGGQYQPEIHPPPLSIISSSGSKARATQVLLTQGDNGTSGSCCAIVAAAEASGGGKRRTSQFQTTPPIGQESAFQALVAPVSLSPQGDSFLCLMSLSSVPQRKMSSC